MKFDLNEYRKQYINVFVFCSLSYLINLSPSSRDVFVNKVVDFFKLHKKEGNTVRRRKNEEKEVLRKLPSAPPPRPLWEIQKTLFQQY